MRKAQTTEKVNYPAPDVATKVIPAPTEGWDAISPLADMSPQRAPILDNFVPRPGYIESRKGYQVWVTSTLGSAIETLMVYQQPTVVTMYAATASGSILNVTSSATTATVIATTFSNGRWEWVNFKPAGANAVIQFVNGTDALQMISGTVSVIATVTITGLSVISSTAATSNFNNIAVVKRRLWYVLEDSTIAVFLPTDAITGAIAGYLDLGALWKKGGYLVAIGNWTIDGGAGPDDYTVFISSEGQLAIYSGVDPTTSAWELKGTFDVAHPIGKRCIYKFGSDLLIITNQGVLPISQVLPFDPSADRSSAITTRIQNAMIQAAQTYENNFGWEIMSHPEEALLYLNVPVTSASQQYVMNTVTGAWCRFTGWDANTFTVFNDKLYFADNNVNQAYIGGIDKNTYIQGDIQCAFNWYDTPGRLKRMTLLQPLLTLTDNMQTPSIGVDVDFGMNATVSSTPAGGSPSLWDAALWDVGVWGGTVYTQPWLSVNAYGKALAVRVILNYESDTSGTPPSLQINAFNTIVELGGMI